MKFGCSNCFFLNTTNLICRITDISKCFRGSLRFRDNESRLYIVISSNWHVQSLIELLVLSHNVKELPLRYLKLVTVPSFCPFTLISLCMPSALDRIKYVYIFVHDEQSRFKTNIYGIRSRGALSSAKLLLLPLGCAPMPPPQPLPY